MTIAPLGRRFTSWVRRIHIYAGLLNFSMLMVFGLAGLVITFKAPDIMHSGLNPDTRAVGFTAPESLSDKRVGERIASGAGRPSRAGEYYIHRDDSNRLVWTGIRQKGLCAPCTSSRSIA